MCRMCEVLEKQGGEAYAGGPRRAEWGSHGTTGGLVVGVEA